MPGGGVGDDGGDDPAEGEAGDDEEDEDVVGGELVGALVLVDEPALRWCGQRDCSVLGREGCADLRACRRWGR